MAEMRSVSKVHPSADKVIIIAGNVIPIEYTKSAEKVVFVKVQKPKSTLKQFLQGKKELSRPIALSLRALFGAVFALIFLPYFFFFMLKHPLDPEMITPVIRMAGAMFLTFVMCIFMMLGCLFSKRFTCISVIAAIDILSNRGRWILILFVMGMLWQNQTVVPNIMGILGDVKCAVGKGFNLIDQVKQLLKALMGDLGTGGKEVDEEKRLLMDKMLTLLGKIKPEPQIVQEIKDMQLKSNKTAQNDALTVLLKSLLSKSNSTNATAAPVEKTPVEQLTEILVKAGGCSSTFYGQLPGFVVNYTIKKVGVFLKDIFLDILLVIKILIIVLIELIYALFLLSFVLAARYVTRFLLSDGCDNNKIDFNFDRAWEENDIEEMTDEYGDGPKTILPIRRYETLKNSYSYRMASLPPMADIIWTIIGLVPPVIVFLIVLGTMGVDIFIHEMLEYLGNSLRNELKPGASALQKAYEKVMEGCAKAGQGTKPDNQSFDIADCAPNPVDPQIGGYIFIIFIMMIVFILVMFESYCNRAKPVIVSFFYPTRGLQRAKHLRATMKRTRHEHKDELEDTVNTLWWKKKRERQVGVISRCTGKAKKPVPNDRCLICDIAFKKQKMLGTPVYVATTTGEMAAVCVECSM